jgi:GNAT superfamily N-acetyltransferase
MSLPFQIRHATAEDCAIIAVHRARMFQEMGLVTDQMFDPFRATCEKVIRQMLLTGEYVGWLASPKESPKQSIAGAGVQLRRVLPHPAGPSKDGPTIREGHHAIIINVFTEPEWRHRGAAKLLIETIIGWSREQNLDRLVLHASDAGRGLYEKLGFIATNEMRYNR